MSGAQSKATNPKDAIGTAKVPISMVSMQVIYELETYMGPVNPIVLAELGLAMMEGALKYGRHNYRIAGVRASVYYDAAFRHRAAWILGQDIDPDSGVSHVTKGIATLTVLRDSMIQGNWTDDRPPRGVARGLIQDALGAWWEGEDSNGIVNPSNGCETSNIIVALSQLVRLRTEQVMGTWVDDRGEKAPDINWVAGLNEKAAELLKRYPNPKLPFTEGDIFGALVREATV
jgi:hypothetical protein